MASIANTTSNVPSYRVQIEESQYKQHCDVIRKDFSVRFPKQSLGNIIRFDDKAHTIVFDMAALEIKALFEGSKEPLLKKFPYQNLYPAIKAHINQNLKQNSSVVSVTRDVALENEFEALHQKSLDGFSKASKAKPNKAKQPLTKIDKKVLQQQGVVIGEMHAQSSARKLLIDHAQFLKGKTIVLEHIMGCRQAMLDTWMNDKSDAPMPPAIQAMARFFDKCWEREASGVGCKYPKEYSLEALLLAAKEHGIRIVGFETEVSLNDALRMDHARSAIKNLNSQPDRGRAAICRHSTDCRVLHMNHLVFEAIKDAKCDPSNAIFLVGALHGPSYKTGEGIAIDEIPGIMDYYQLGGCWITDPDIEAMPNELAKALKESAQKGMPQMNYSLESSWVKDVVSSESGEYKGKDSGQGQV